MEIKPYKKDFEYSYTLGAFPTFELIDAMPEQVEKVLVHSSFTDREKLMRVCAGWRIPVETNDRIISKLSDKENVFVVGVFRKFSQKLDTSKSHVVLVNPSNMGNLGTIIRTSCGFGFYDLAIIGQGADVFNPKTVRASMGSLFRIRHHYYADFDEYLESCGQGDRKIFTFMLNGQKPLTVNDVPKPQLYSLVFGNEATGLDDSYLERGTSIIIPQTEYVDSLNLTIAVGIGEFMFSH